MKHCTTCNSLKQLTDFCSDKSKADGLRSQCKECSSKSKKNHKKNYSVTVDSHICIKCKGNKTIIEFDRNKANPSGLNNICKVCRILISEKAYEKHKDRIKSTVKKYYTNNYEKVKETRRKYAKKKKEDILWVLKRRLRNRLYYALQKTTWKKNTHFSQYIGCSLEELKEHLNKQLHSGMNWDNYGQWHIDHIIPLASAQTEQELYKLCHYTNLQPMWGIDNIKKGCKM